MGRALVIVDIQNDYFPGGRHELVGSEQAAANAATVLDGFRRRAEQILHVQHVWEGEGAEFFEPGTRGVEIHDAVRPAGDEPVVQKAYPNSFRETDLESRLRDAGVTAGAGRPDRAMSGVNGRRVRSDRRCRRDSGRGDRAARCRA